MQAYTHTLNSVPLVQYRASNHTSNIQVSEVNPSAFPSSTAPQSFVSAAPSWSTPPDGNQEEVENSQQFSPLLVTLPQCVNLPRLQDSHVVDTHAHEHRLINSPVAITSPSCSTPCNASDLPIPLGDQSIPSQDGPPCDQSHSSGVGLSSNPGSNGSARDGSCHELLDMSFTGHALDQVDFTYQDQYSMQDQSLDSLTGRVRQCDIASSSQGHGQIEIGALQYIVITRPDIAFAVNKVGTGKLQINEIPAYEQVADVLTKPLSAPAFCRHRLKLSVVPMQVDSQLLESTGCNNTSDLEL
ncbi:hypothetical protein V6N11_044241 [Hibiscus sabdariffa]|uniref:Uncharacterized protein n=1 Tax=Hibiscus sabdariffa TaxID=183260 RepID=A0ABR2REZ6_9ROSI